MYIRGYTSPNENFEYGYLFLMHFCRFAWNWSIASRTSFNEIWRNWWRQGISDTISQDMLSQIFDVIQLDVALQKQVH